MIQSRHCLLVCILPTLAAPLGAYINPNYTPVDLVEQSEQIVKLTVGASPSASKPR